jgi:hypothetical protein
MTAKRHRIGLASFALLAATALSRGASADEVDDAFQAGNRALEAGKWGEAESHYEVAFAGRPGADIAANLAQAETELGKKAEAAEHLAYALRMMPASTRPEQRKAMEGLLADLKKVVCEITVETNVAGATISVDGRKVGTTPLQSGVFVEPGKRVIKAELAAHSPASASVDAAAGGQGKVSLELKPGDGAGGGGGKPLWPIGVLAGAGAAGLGVGIAGFVLWSQKKGDADDALAAVPDGGCGPDGTLCAAIADQYGESDGFLAMGVAGITVGGALGLGALIYALVPESEPTVKTGGVRVVPWVGETTGLIVEGSF